MPLAERGEELVEEENSEPELELTKPMEEANEARIRIRGRRYPSVGRGHGRTGDPHFVSCWFEVQNKRRIAMYEKDNNLKTAALSTEQT